MNFIKTLLFGKNNPDKLKLRYVKEDDTWHVLKGTHILYIGDKEKCKTYIQNAQLKD